VAGAQAYCMERTRLKGKVSLSCFSNFNTASHLLVPVPGMDRPLSLFPVRCGYGYSGDSSVLRLALEDSTHRHQ
jgi:hypothetical protein